MANFKKGLTCQQYLIMVGLIKGMSYQAAKTRTWELLKELDLTAVAKKNPNKFSSGLKKKLLIANILFTDCDVIILDEPTDNLDPDMRLWIIKLIKKLNAEGKTILICTHILSEVEELLDSLTIIKEGKILYSGTRPKLINPVLEISFLDSTSEKIFQNYAQQNNLAYQKINDTCIITLSEPKQIFLEKLYQLKIKPSKLKEHHETLYDLYNKYIK
ncbi:ATP-binding cassette domain-containing protein [Spiroplasma sp. DGKH1]|uniref:ATP-binding cassette domain-containing protein n=1 Tax=Spiroplasma sp. DGKH1 TaxID=3050074 RepID=UPI0034C651C0